MNKNVRYKMYETYEGGKNMWMIKPTSYNRGRGIRIFNNLDVLVKYLKEYWYGVAENKIF